VTRAAVTPELLTGLAALRLTRQNFPRMAAPPADSQLESLVRQFSRLVRSVAARVGGPAGREIADDVEQVVFLNLWKQLQREQNITNPSSYIYRCAVRETIRLLQDGRAKDAEPDEPADPPAEALTPDGQLESKERAAVLGDAIRTLAIDRRRAVQAYLAGFSVAETMTMYGWSYERARNLSTRGMADLRAELKRRGIND
jgi:RNA polymerase sigma factor (sigma-70 family)